MQGPTLNVLHQSLWCCSTRDSDAQQRLRNTVLRPVNPEALVYFFKKIPILGNFMVSHQRLKREVVHSHVHMLDSIRICIGLQDFLY